MFSYLLLHISLSAFKRRKYKRMLSKYTVQTVLPMSLAVTLTCVLAALSSTHWALNQSSGTGFVKQENICFLSLNRQFPEKPAHKTNKINLWSSTRSSRKWKPSHSAWVSQHFFTSSSVFGLHHLLCKESGSSAGKLSIYNFCELFTKIQENLDRKMLVDWINVV